MINAIHKTLRHSMLVSFLILLIVGAGCKSQKKALAIATADKARLEQEAATRKQQEEEQKKRDDEEKFRKEQETRDKERAAVVAPATKLEQYFSAIASAGNVSSANSSISEALTLFASDDTPVLIVISESGGQKDYDRPTTIKAYLNYLKDQKKNANKVGNLQFDSAGKINEVELVK